MAASHYCKECFKGLRGKHISDKFILMSENNGFCDSCERSDRPVVVYYFKYGEQTTEDCKRLAKGPRHVGINPDYSFFEQCSIYPEHERKQQVKEAAE